MTHSEQINEITAACAKALAALEPAVKDALNPAFRSKYADYAAIVEAAKVYAKEGVAWFQDPTTTEAGVAVETMLSHTSGQWIKFGPLVVPTAKKDAHGIGSAATYAKRYALSAALGISAEEDDDGNAAVGKPATVVDTTTGEDMPLGDAPAPPGYHYVTNYQSRNGWHEATVLRWDLQGGSMKVSTKNRVGEVLAEAARTGIPAKVDVKVKPNTRGEAYLNAITLWKDAPPPVEPLPDITPEDCPF